MKLVVLERNSVGTDIPVDCYEDFGEVTYYRNTVLEDCAEKVKDADIVLLDTDLNVTDVFALGKQVVKEKAIVAKNYYQY